MCGDGNDAVEAVDDVWRLLAGGSCGGGGEFGGDDEIIDGLRTDFSMVDELICDEGVPC